MLFCTRPPEELRDSAERDGDVLETLFDFSTPRSGKEVSAHVVALMSSEQTPIERESRGRAARGGT